MTTNPVPALLAQWEGTRAALHALDEAEHPDLTDRHGRTWTWKDGDLYEHDGLLAFPRDWVQSPTIGLPDPGLAQRNPNYAGLCAICRHEETAP